ncbi:MAG: hypothetical protein ACLVCA_03705 [Peptoniphilus sp.]|uniref:hypothetical protein n=1 Tax=Peptoniphilus sp. TaxID=1971214 RepID=UPI00399A0EA1
MDIKEKLKGTYLENLIKKRKRKKSRKNEYDLCYELSNKKNNIEEMFDEEIREYAEIIYIRNKDKFINNKETRNLIEENIRKDLLALRILKDEMKQKIGTSNYGITFISIFVASITVIMNRTFSGVVLLIYVLILALIYILFAKRYEEKLNCTNYAINILEDIKEDIHFQKEKESKEDECRYRVDLLNSLNSLKENNSDGILESKNEYINKNPIEFPETKELDIEVDNVADQVSEPRSNSLKANENLEDAIELLDEKNQKEYSQSIMKKNIFEPYGIEADEKGVISYKDSYGIKNDLTTKSKGDLAKYINDRYCNVNEQSKEDILKDLAVFKNLRKTLELEYRSYESFIKNVAFIIAILSFAIQSTKDLIMLSIPVCVARIILFVSFVYLIGTGIYLVKTVDRKNGPGKLDVIDYGINVLEIKLKELDGNQDK